MGSSQIATRVQNGVTLTPTNCCAANRPIPWTKNSTRWWSMASRQKTGGFISTVYAVMASKARDGAWAAAGREPFEASLQALQQELPGEDGFPVEKS